MDINTSEGLEDLARLLGEHGATTVGDLPEHVVIPRLADSARAIFVDYGELHLLIADTEPPAVYVCDDESEELVEATWDEAERAAQTLRRVADALLGQLFPPENEVH